MQIGLDRNTGASITGWDHVLQSLWIIFTTGFGDRVMREWFGSAIPTMLGRTMVPETVLRFVYASVLAIELWEPRFKVVSVTALNGDRGGTLSFKLSGQYYPNAMTGDFSISSRASAILSAGASGLVISPFNG